MISHHGSSDFSSGYYDAALISSMFQVKHRITALSRAPLPMPLLKLSRSWRVSAKPTLTVWWTVCQPHRQKSTTQETQNSLATSANASGDLLRMAGPNTNVMCMSFCYPIGQKGPSYMKEGAADDRGQTPYSRTYKTRGRAEAAARLARHQ